MFKEDQLTGFTTQQRLEMETLLRKTDMTQQILSTNTVLCHPDKPLFLVKSFSAVTITSQMGVNSQKKKKVFQNAYVANVIR